jgi:hypothetical protein
VLDVNPRRSRRRIFQATTLHEGRKSSSRKSHVNLPRFNEFPSFAQHKILIEESFSHRFTIYIPPYPRSALQLSRKGVKNFLRGSRSDGRVLRSPHSSSLLVAMRWANRSRVRTGCVWLQLIPSDAIWGGGCLLYFN